VLEKPLFIVYFKVVLSLFRGMHWHSWLRHCTTSWKVAGLIPDGGTWDRSST